jgi:ferredoxin
MLGAIVYFSGTGNTEFAAKLFKNKFAEKGIECSLIDISKKRNLNNNYDFYIFGAPIYADTFPDYFKDWVKNKVNDGQGKKCIVFSTQAENDSSGPGELTQILEEKGFVILIQDFIVMPNNYYMAGFNKANEDKVTRLKELAIEEINLLVEKFLQGEKYIKRISEVTQIKGELLDKKFYKPEKSWAQSSLSIDYDLCVKCGKCAKNCPTGNISMKEEITFKDKCISCQKCVHRCPVNAFLYNGKPIDQYKI